MKTDTAESLNSLASSLGFNLNFESPEALKQSNRALADALTLRGLDLAKIIAQYPTDELTGLNNKNDLLRYGWLSLAEADREGQHVTIVFCDVDNFKPLNTKYGEKKVDEMVKAGGWAIREVLRPYDKAWRFGGDEFIFVLKGKGLPNVSSLIQRIERKWEQRLAQKGLPKEAIRLSFGFTLIKPREGRGNQANQDLFESSLSEAVLKMRRMKADKKALTKLQ
jgi:diguanylate cyclase (GGDEF)-like protein